MPNPNDIVRDEILRYLHSVHQKARSPKTAGLKITELTAALKLKGFKQQEVASNLDYLVQKGWVREVIERRSFTTPRGTTQEAEKRTYKISDTGIDKFEAASTYQRSSISPHVNITNIRGVTVVGDGNVVNTTFTDLSRVLSDMRQAVLSEQSLPDERKLEVVADIDSLQSQLQKPRLDKSIIARLWEGIQAGAAVGGVIDLLRTASDYLGPLLR